MPVLSKNWQHALMAIPIPVRAALITCCAVALLQAAVAAAQTGEFAPAGPLTGVLKRVRDTGVVRIGYRESSIPFSFEGPGRQPYGYSIDLCHAIVEEITNAIGGKSPRTEYRRVTPEDRIAQVVSGSIDLECGSTTNTAERRKSVAFSPLIFVAGTRLAVNHGSAIRSYRDMAGLSLVVSRGTTNEEVMRRLISSGGLRTTILTVGDLGEAFAALAGGRAHALAADDILLYGYLAEKGFRARYDVVGELLSYEPYGLMYARDDQALADAVTSAFSRLAATRELRLIYNKWFLLRLPSGVRLGLTMSQQLERSFAILGLPPD